MSATTENLGYLIHHLATSLARQTDQILMHDLGLGFSQFKVLMVLKENYGAQQKQLADQLGQTEASISRQVKGLQQAKLLTSRRNPDDRREHITILTSRGEQLLDEAMTIVNHHFGPMFAELGSADQQQLWNILTKMHKLVCQPGKTGSCNHA